MNNEELIWVEKEFAEKYKVLKSDKSKREERIKVFNEYMQTIKNASAREFKANFENLEEDVAIYTGLMLKVKQAFEKAKNEQLDASYKLWTKFEDEIPNINEKIAQITNTLEPLIEKTNKLNEQFSKIQTWNIEKLVESMEKIANLYGTEKEMFKFLVNNFKLKEERS